MMAAERWRTGAGTLGQRLVPGIVGMVALTLVVVTTVILQIATEQDRVAAEHARQLVVAALEARKAAIPRSVQDYAYWGDAYRNLHVRLNTAWAYDQGNFGASLRAALGLDLAFVIGPHGQTTYAVIDGKLVREHAPGRLRGGLDRLIRQARAGIGDAPEPVIALLEADGAPAIVGAAMLTPGGDATVRPIPGPASVLVFADVLAPAKLAAVGASHFVEGLRVVRPGEELAPLLPLATLDTTPLPGLTWRQPTPGRDLLRQVLPWLLFAIVAMGPLSWFVLRRAASEASHRALAESEARFRGTFENAAVGIAHVGLDGVWLRVNRRLGEIVGYAREELLRHGLENVAHLEGTAPSPEQAERLRSGEIPFDHVERRGVHKDGHPVWISQTTSVQHDAGGRPLYLIVVIEDITKRKRAETVKSRFLATMSHEIRTPLTAILGFTDLLARSKLSAEQQEQLGIVRDTGRVLLTVVNDILDLSKLEAGKMSLERIPVDLAGLLREALATVELLGAEKGLAFRLELAPDLPHRVESDPVRLRQVVGNLLANALKFTARGSVTLRARAVGQDGPAVRVRVEVEDTGIGVAREDLPRLFSMFEQADQTTTRRFGGTGLGLAIAKRLVEAMGGAIGAASRPGVGSTFWCELPLEPASPEEQPLPSPATTRAAPGRTLEVLVVDDIATNRMLLRALLQSLGHAPTLAEDGVRAAAMAARGRFDLILMDLHMPGMDGFMAAQAIRSGGGPNATTPIVALSADVLPETASACRAAGMDGHLAKPIDRPRLRELLGGIGAAAPAR
jgi:PAS domain S-box-containing protein